MFANLKSALKSCPPFAGLVRERQSLRMQLQNANEQLLLAQTEVASLRSRLVGLEAKNQSNEAALSSFRHGLCYDHDCLKNYNKNMSWLREPAFVEAYRAGNDSGHKIGRAAGSNDDIHIEWRVHTACWAARHALHLPGDFVECGVNTGILSLAICNYIRFNETGRSFYLYDTFKGIPEEQMLPSERPGRSMENESLYEECFETARRNFAPFPKARLIRGMVPDTLTQVAIEKVCYLSIDMNIAYPEIAAIEYFWDKLVSGAIVLLDDYGWAAYYEQQLAWDAFASRKGVAIATLPTGQGLLIKP
jgi:hypothetical protein